MTHPLDFLNFYNRIHAINRFEYIGYSSQLKAWVVSTCGIKFWNIDSNTLYNAENIRVLKGIDDLDTSLAYDKSLSIFKDNNQDFLDHNKLKKEIVGLKSKIKTISDATTHKVYGVEVEFEPLLKNKILTDLHIELGHLESEFDNLYGNRIYGGLSISAESNSGEVITFKIK